MRRSREKAARTRDTAVKAASFESKEALAAEACAAAFAGSGLARERASSTEAMLRGAVDDTRLSAALLPGTRAFRIGNPEESAIRSAKGART